MSYLATAERSLPSLCNIFRFLGGWGRDLGRGCSSIWTDQEKQQQQQQQQHHHHHHHHHHYYYYYSHHPSSHLVRSSKVTMRPLALSNPHTSCMIHAFSDKLGSYRSMHKSLHDQVAGILSQFPSTTSITPQMRLLLLSVAAAAAGRSHALRSYYECLDPVHRTKCVEGLLQNTVLVGVPRVITTMVELSQTNLLFPPQDDLSSPLSLSQSFSSSSSSSSSFVSRPFPPILERPDNHPEMYRRQGIHTFEQVYGEKSSKVLKIIEGVHPDLKSWTLEFVYGRVLSRPGLSLMEREMCCVAVIAGLDTPALLVSHIRGALRAGASREVIQAVLDQTTVIWGEKCAEKSNAVWNTFENARYGL